MVFPLESREGLQVAPPSLAKQNLDGKRPGTASSRASEATELTEWNV